MSAIKENISRIFLNRIYFPNTWKKILAKIDTFIYFCVILILSHIALFEDHIKKKTVLSEFICLFILFPSDEIKLTTTLSKCLYLSYIIMVKHDNLTTFVTEKLTAVQLDGISRKWLYKYDILLLETFWKISDWCKYSEYMKLSKNNT